MCGPILLLFMEPRNEYFGVFFNGIWQGFATVGDMGLIDTQTAEDIMGYYPSGCRCGKQPFICY